MAESGKTSKSRQMAKMLGTCRAYLDRDLDMTGHEHVYHASDPRLSCEPGVEKHLDTHTRRNTPKHYDEKKVRCNATLLLLESSFYLLSNPSTTDSTKELLPWD